MALNPDNLNTNLDSESFSRIIESAPIGILTFSSEWKIEYCNQNFLKLGLLYDFDAYSLIGTNILDENLFPSITIHNDLLELKNGIPFEKEIANIKTAGHGEISLLVKGSPLFKDENFDGGIILVEDIRIVDSAKNVEDLNSAQYEKIINNLNDFLFVTDKQGNIKQASGKKISTLHLHLNAVNEKNISKIFPLNEQTIFNEKLFSSVNERISKLFEIELTIENEYNIYECKIEPLQNKHGQVNFVFIFLNNITKDINEKRKLEEELQTLKHHQFINEAPNEAESSTKNYRGIFLSSEELICTLKPDGTIINANPKFLNSLRYSETEIINSNIQDIVDPKFITLTKFDLRSFLENKKFYELPLITKRGNKLILSAKFIPVYEEESLIFINAFLTDITEKKLTENNLNIFKSLFEVSQDGIALLFESKIILANDALASIFKYNNGESLINFELTELVAIDDIYKVAEYMQLIENKKEPPSRFEFLGKRRDEIVINTEAAVSTFYVDDKLYTVLFIRDITERKKVQLSIRQSEEKYRNIAENIDDFLYTIEKTEKEFRPVFLTQSVEKITGYTIPDLLNDSRLFLKIIHPDDFELVKKKISNIFRSKIQHTDEFEFRFISKQGNMVWVRNKLHIVKDENDEVKKVYGLISDISLRKKAEEELQKSTENLIKLNETKDKFISIVSHDLRTPFSSILGFADLILNDDEVTNEEVKQYVGFIQESSR
ncbi:MAG: PAS domain S-box protein, partial [Ignavibacteriaceae bacterium]